MSKIGNKELARVLSERYELERTSAEEFVGMMFEIINDGLKYDKLVKVKGLGTFKVTSVASRKSVDVNTGEPIIIEGRDKINFTADTPMRDLVNRPFAQFETVVVNDGVDFEDIDHRFADTMTENEEQADSDGEEEDGTVGSHGENMPPRTEPLESVEEAVTERKENTNAVSFEAEDETAPLQIESRHLAMLNQAESKKAEAPKETTTTLIDVQSSGQEESTGKEMATGHVAVPDSVAVPGVLSLSMEQLAVLNGKKKPQENPQEVSMPPYERPEEHKEPVVTPRQEIDEELQRVKYRTDELTEVVERQHRYMKTLIGIAALLAVICVGGWMYMASQLEKRNNRIQHLEAETLTLQHIGKAAVSPQQSIDSAAIMKAKEDSVLHAMQLAEIEKARKDSALKVEEAAHKERVAARQREIEESRKRAEERMKAEAKKAENTKALPEKKVQTPSQSAYDKDVRIRTGAYNIVGIDRTVTVRSGQTLAGISKAYLGAGMECYVEAVNGGRKEFKAGEKVNIPKLQLKKR